jgi:predicted Zn-dependent peptidase
LKVVFDPIDLPQEFAETERDIVLREYDLRMANNPDAQAAEAMEAFLYEGNAIAASVIGTPTEIKAVTFDDAKAFHDATHRPERARLVVIGDVSQSQLDDAMQQAGFPDLDAKRDDIAPPPFTLAAPETQTFRYPDPAAAPPMTWRKVVALPETVDFDLLEAQTALARDILDRRSLAWAADRAQGKPRQNHRDCGGPSGKTNNGSGLVRAHSAGLCRQHGRNEIATRQSRL